MRQITFSFILFTLSYLSLTNFVTTGFYKIFTPVQIGLRVSAKDIISFTDFLSGVEAISNDNTLINKELADVYSLLADYKILEQENSALKDQLAVTAIDYKGNVVMAKVISVSNTYLVLGAGSDAGINIGDNVIFGNHLVGIVSSVTSIRAKVAIITSPDVSVSAKASKSEGVVSGNYGVNLIYSNILQEESVNIYEVIFSSGKDGRFLSDFILGRVSTTSTDAAAPLIHSEAQTVIDISKLTNVFVLRGL